LIFTVAGERYALPLQELAEVLPFQGCTPVPGSSPSILGVMNLRGEIRPLIDLACVLSAGTALDSGAVLVLRRPLALKVDRIEDLREIRREELNPAAPGTFIQGMASGTLALLDIETILSAVLSRKESRSE
jgi:purine-binding chemotaxis protein CheW